jgi:hypothetical protein
MPIHDWSAVDPGLFHDFHQSWTVELAAALNAGLLGPDYYALLTSPYDKAEAFKWGSLPEEEIYARIANRIAIKQRDGKLIAMVLVSSPGDLTDPKPLVAELAGLLKKGINLLVVNLFSSQGIHKAIWDEFGEEPFELPPDKPLTIAAYCAAELKTAYVEPVAIGDPLPSLPIFLTPAIYVPAPLEETYLATWSKCPAPLREAVEKSSKMSPD